MKIKELKDELKPFFIFVLIFEVVYVIFSILVAYPIWRIVEAIRSHKRFRKQTQRNE